MIASHSWGSFIRSTIMISISCFATYQSWPIRLRSGTCRGHLSTLNSLLSSGNQFEMIWAFWHGGSSRSKLSTQLSHSSHHIVTPATAWTIKQGRMELCFFIVIQLSKCHKTWSYFPVLSWDWWCICSCSQSASTFDALCLNLAPHLRFNEWLLELLFLSSQLKADWPFSSHLWHQHDIFCFESSSSLEIL